MQDKQESLEENGRAFSNDGKALLIEEERLFSRNARMIFLAFANRHTWKTLNDMIFSL